MGFYGNITNTSRTQFQFDKIFPNRTVMDNNTSTDGVYIGRYVLIEYDNQMLADWCTIAYQKTTVNGITRFYSAPMDKNGNPQIDTEFKYGNGNIIENKYIRVPGVYKDEKGNVIIHNYDNETNKSDTIYKILGGNNDYISIKPISELENSPYNENYNIDIEKYGPGRGYDSTVWQKVYTNGQEQYVMIAELNSVVPTFGVSADAPTMSPIIPHFDADSSNVYYKVHWQPGWGLRVKSASQKISVKPTDEAGNTIMNSTEDITMSKIESNVIPSDETTIWTRTIYDTSSGETKNFYYQPNNPQSNNVSGQWKKLTGTPNDGNIPAAIYYNKAGFNPNTISYSTVEDKINVTPTGLSGNLYNNHDNTGSKSAQVDTQELSIMLPSIGNSIAKMWDIVYGNKEINGGSTTRNTNINWNSTDGLRLITTDKSGYGYHTDKVSTLAGAINSVFDLMGMIIQDDKTETSDISEFDETHIYYLKNQKKFYKKHKTYTYTEVGSVNPSGEKLYVISDSAPNYPIGMEWNMNVIEIPTGVALGTRQEDWELKELEGFAREFNTIHGLILNISNILEAGNKLTRDTNTIQGSINKLKDIFAQFGELHPTEVIVTDKYGRITSTGLADDDWISATYSDNDENRKITVVHQYIGKDTGKGDHIVNGESEDRVLNYGDTFISPSFKFNTDDMGHVNSFSTNYKTLTMPTMEYTPGESGNVMIDLSMSAGSGANKITFTQSKANVGTLELAEYLMTTGETNVTKIAETDSINTAFSKINTAFNSLDYAMEENQNVYVSKVEETNGIIKVTTVPTSTITALGTVTSGTWDSTIAENRVTNSSILNSAVTTEKVNDLAVTTDKIANESITNIKLAVNSVTEVKINNSAVTTDKIKNSSVTTEKIADNAVTSDKIESLVASKITDVLSEDNIPNLKMDKITEGNLIGSRVLLTEYAIDTNENQSITADDTVLSAIAKLEKRIADLEAKIQALEEPEATV